MRFTVCVCLSVMFKQKADTKMPERVTALCSSFKIYVFSVANRWLVGRYLITACRYYYYVHPSGNHFKGHPKGVGLRNQPLLVFHQKKLESFSKKRQTTSWSFVMVYGFIMERHNVLQGTFRNAAKRRQRLLISV